SISSCPIVEGRANLSSSSSSSFSSSEIGQSRTRTRRRTMTIGLRLRCAVPLSVQIVANRDDFRSAEFIPPERELRQHALDNSPTLFVDQPSCGLKSPLVARSEEHTSELQSPDH